MDYLWWSLCLHKARCIFLTSFSFQWKEYNALLLRKYSQFTCFSPGYTGGNRLHKALVHCLTGACDNFGEVSIIAYIPFCHQVFSVQDSDIPIFYLKTFAPAVLSAWNSPPCPYLWVGSLLSLRRAIQCFLLRGNAAQTPVISSCCHLGLRMFLTPNDTQKS